LEHGDPGEAFGGFDRLEELGGNFVDFGDKVGVVGEGERGEEVAEVGGGFELGGEGGQVRDAARRSLKMEALATDLVYS